MDRRAFALAVMVSVAAACGAASKQPVQSPAPPDQGPSASTQDSTGGGTPPISPTVQQATDGTSQAPVVQTRGRDSAKTERPPPPPPPPPGGGGGGGAGAPDPKEVARSSGLTGPTDQGSFSEGFDDSVTIAKLAGVEGDAEKDVRDAVTHQIGTIEGCYRDALKKNAKLHGTFTITVYVGIDGTLQSAALVGTKPGDKALEKCMLATLGGAKLAHGLGKKTKLTLALAFKAP